MARRAGFCMLDHIQYVKMLAILIINLKDMNDKSKQVL